MTTDELTLELRGGGGGGFFENNGKVASSG